MEVDVSWDDYNESAEYDLQYKQAFIESISGYIRYFKALPPKGLWIQTGICDSAYIENVYFNGIDTSAFFWLVFE